mmetsp:Transcript_16678/g.39824  ORF Transcript_16678/g.39824 Transcript_16678/m.39824 type:complete len:123 (+) Transcript_16678:368-736(+)
MAPVRLAPRTAVLLAADTRVAQAAQPVARPRDNAKRSHPQPTAIGITPEYSAICRPRRSCVGLGLGEECDWMLLRQLLTGRMAERAGHRRQDYTCRSAEPAELATLKHMLCAYINSCHSMGS